METSSSLLGLCARNSPVTGEFPARKPETWSFDIFFDVRLKKRLSKQWFETQSRSLWRHCNKLVYVKFNKLNTTSRQDTDKCRQESLWKIFKMCNNAHDFIDDNTSLVKHAS